MIDQKNTKDTLVSLNTRTLFIFSTSGSLSSLEKHNTALQHMGINLAYFSFAHSIVPETYANLLRSPISRGGAVTGQGLKIGVIPFLDWIDDTSKTIGVVNTVVNHNGELHGYDTDAFGFQSAIQNYLAKSNNQIKKAIIYGNGGVSGVASYILQSMGIATTMTGRNPERVKAKMRELHLTPLDGPFDLVVNATPVSSDKLENATGLLDVLQGSKVVFDHNMPEKDGNPNYLKLFCDSNGIDFIPGNDMYIAQMIKQWTLFLDGFTDEGHTWHITEADIKKYWRLKL